MNSGHFVNGKFDKNMVDSFSDEFWQKTNSEGVKNKNLRDFNKSESLFDIKIKQLLKVFNPEDIMVSSENPNVKKLTDNYDIKFHLRDISLTKSNALENQIVKTLVEAVEDKSSDIMWVQVTQPLFNEFEEIIDVWNEKKTIFDSLAVVKKFRHHLLDENGNPINFNFGYWHKISQDLPKYYEVTWAAFIMSRSMLNQTYYQIGRRPYLYETKAPLVDIDNESDFEVVSILYNHYKQNGNALVRI